MAEYIDRNLIEWYGCDFEDASCENRECSDCSHAECSHSQVMQIPTANVIPIPEGATSGDMIKAMFPNVIISEGEDTVHLKYPTVNSDPLFFVQLSKDWWNAKYKKGTEE